MKKHFPPAVDAAVKALSAGKFVIIMDDEKRENEGDLVLAAEFATPEKLAFIIHHTGGVVCLALSNSIADQLDLPAMAQRNTNKRTALFTVSIEAKSGVSTGISASDRAKTIRTAIDPKTSPDDLSSPGHVFPLRAQDGGVLWRAGHTEASIDLCKLAGMREGAVVSELMKEDGTMMRANDIKSFAKKHKIPILMVKDLIEHRRSCESLILLAARSELDTRYGHFDISVYTDVSRREHVALVMGDIKASEQTLVRVHSECITGDVFGSHHCDCGGQLDLAMRMIAKEGKGVLVYLRQEGRGIGLTNKIKAYALQHLGMDTVDANRALGLPDDLREYGVGAQILKDVGVGKMRLLTNNPKKVIGLEGYGLTITQQVPIEISPKYAKQKTYLKTKKKRMKHRLKRV
jgi:3,4-dihydroxy 2-butanone 4-phosphate synthase/GTP cyclohydrolase II